MGFGDTDDSQGPAGLGMGVAQGWAWPRVFLGCIELAHLRVVYRSTHAKKGSKVADMGSDRTVSSTRAITGVESRIEPCLPHQTGKKVGSVTLFESYIHSALA